MAKRPLFIHKRPKMGPIAKIIQHWQFWLTSILAIIGTWLVINQNQLMENQNKLIERQMSLDEASRRSALVMLLSNIMDKVDDEIKEQKNDLLKKGIAKVAVDTMKFSLSQSLIGQIAALSHSFKPYRYMDGDSLISKPLSPERGQLLITLTQLPIDTLSLYAIYKNSNFKSADLQFAQLSRAKFKYIDLASANMRQGFFVGSDFSNSNLTSTDFTSSSLSESNFSNATMNGSQLEDCVLIGANFMDADLSEVEDRGCINCPLSEDTTAIKAANFQYSDLRGTSFVGAKMSGANLSRTIMGRFHLPEIGTWPETCFIGAELDKVDFSNSQMNFYVHFTREQARSVSSFYECNGLNDSIEILLKQELPQLFQKPK